MHDVCLREIASQATASRQLRTASDHVTDSTTTISFYLSGYFTPPALRHKSYTEPDRHSVLFCSVSSQPTRHTRHILPAASRYCNALFCHTPFNSIPAGQPPPNLSDLPCRPPVGTAMFCSVLFCAARSIPFRLTPSYRPTAHGHAVLFCYASFRYALPSIYPTYPAGRQYVPHCPVLCCQFNSIPAYTLLPADCRKPVSLFCSVSSRHARSARPYQTIPNLPDLPSLP